MPILVHALFGCPAPGQVPEQAAVGCADPGRRAEQPWDRVLIPGDASSEHRLWDGGIVAADLDGDGDVDLFAPGPDGARLLRNDGGTWVDDPSAVPDLDFSFAAGGSAADLDRDGDLDLVVTRWGPPDLLLINDGDGRFIASDALPALPGHSQSAAWADSDGDGDLDLVIAGHGAATPGEQISVDQPGDPTTLWLGDGDGGLVDATDRIPEGVRGGYTFVAGWAQLDDDPRPDLVFANDYPIVVPSLATLNVDGTFVVAEDRGLTHRRAGMGLGIGDADGDGVDDLLMPVWDDVLALVSVGGVWVDASEAIGIVVPPRDQTWVGWGAEWVDLDNDADLDAVVAFGQLDAIGEYSPAGGPTENADDQRFAVYVQADGRFTEQAAALGLDDVGVWRGFAVADLNGDGWPDLARRNLDGPIVLDLSRCGDEAWVRIVPEPLDRAVGAVVTVTAGGESWTRTVHAGGTSLNSGGPPELLFGLGDRESVDLVEVRWPDGEVTVTGSVTARQRVVIR